MATMDEEEMAEGTTEHTSMNWHVRPDKALSECERKARDLALANEKAENGHAFDMAWEAAFKDGWDAHACWVETHES